MCGCRMEGLHCTLLALRVTFKWSRFWLRRGQTWQPKIRSVTLIPILKLAKHIHLRMNIWIGLSVHMHACIMWCLVSLQQGQTCLHLRETLETLSVVRYLAHNGAPIDSPSHVCLVTPLLLSDWLSVRIHAPIQSVMIYRHVLCLCEVVYLPQSNAGCYI